MPTPSPWWSAAALVVYFAFMLLLGYLAYRHTKSLGDYILGGRQLPPAVAALSAGAADMSGWLLMGLPGALYVSGLTSAWMSIGLLIGAWCNWRFVAPRLRAYTEVAGDSLTIPTFFDRRFSDGKHALRAASGIIILVFFTFYVCSGMVAAGTFMHTTFGMGSWWGILIVGGIVLIYTTFGGFLGATWTDVAQGVLMLAALIVVPIMAIVHMGGWSAVKAAVEASVIPQAGSVDGPNLFSFIAGATVLGVISAAAWGLGYFGQPHIIVRFMALKTPQSATFGRRVGIIWMLLISIGACAAGLIGRGFFADTPLANQETVFLALSQVLFHPFLAGLVLSAVLAAIMSTLSSQLIVCSSALIEDLLKLVRHDLPKNREVLAGRLGVVVVAVVAAVLAFTSQDTILNLVAFAWAGFGAAFGPIVLLSLYWKRLTSWGSFAGMVAGAVTVVAWGKSPLSAHLYEIVPGFAICLIVAIVVSLRTAKPSQQIEDEFTQAKALAQQR
ncbi:MAG: sodium/proline symporter PutP [Propionibacteriaceae bacterium]|nr:sodium/proline symporter PutP [Propionibacteriaceae bacterium]